MLGQRRRILSMLLVAGVVACAHATPPSTSTTLAVASSTPATSAAVVYPEPTRTEPPLVGVRALLDHGVGTLFFVEDNLGGPVCREWRVGHGVLARAVTRTCSQVTATLRFEFRDGGIRFEPASSLETSGGGTQLYRALPMRGGAPALLALRDEGEDVLAFGRTHWFGTRTACDTALARGEPPMKIGVPHVDSLIDDLNLPEVTAQSAAFDAFADRLFRGHPLFALEPLNAAGSACHAYAMPAPSREAGTGTVRGMLSRTFRRGSDTVTIGTFLTLDLRCGWIERADDSEEITSSRGEKSSSAVGTDEVDTFVRASDLGWYDSRGECEAARRAGRPALSTLP
jgi:hypothetical protein